MLTRINQTINRQRGIGLLELMLSLAIIAILLIMATRYYLVTSMSEKVNEAITEIQGLQAAAANWKTAYPDYSNFDISTCVKNGWFPDKYTRASGTGPGATYTLVDPWGHDVTPGPTQTDILIKFFPSTDKEAQNLATKLGVTAASDDSVSYYLISQTGTGA